MIHSNIPLTLWCKILFREWHTFWHFRFFTEIWNTKAENCCQQLKYERFPQFSIIRSHLEIRTASELVEKNLPAFLIFLTKSLMAEASVFSTNGFLFSKISAALGNWGMINWPRTPDVLMEGWVSGSCPALGHPAEGWERAETQATLLSSCGGCKAAKRGEGGMFSFPQKMTMGWQGPEGSPFRKQPWNFSLLSVL